VLFNSLQFLIFFPLVVGFYFALPYKYRWILLLAASYYFYGCWKAEYLVLIVASTLIDYSAGLLMSKYPDKRRRRIFLIMSLSANLGLLFSFKYFNFASNALMTLFQFLNIGLDMPMLDVLLPVGISFYTFQTMSYTIDVYRGNTKAEKRFGIFALYVSFFPQLVAGPIERSGRLLGQFYRRSDFEYQRVVDGLKFMLWGFIKKTVIADRLAIIVDQIYTSPTEYSGAFLLLATYLFAFQIYCDFSGYSDIAIGAAKVMGYDLMTNFNRPYFSKSISEFWKRWHISLSTWFRDYLYIPLGGNRVGKWRWYYNLLIVFLISGLWHGANWTFLIWGALHGFYLIFSIWTKDLRKHVSNILALDKIPGIQSLFSVLVTFHLVLFSWIFFRANSLSEALFIIKKIFSDFTFNMQISNITISELGLSAFLIFFLIAAELFQGKTAMLAWLKEKPIWLRWSLYYAGLMLIFFFGVFDSHQFIYFQF
jgi:alginate O-acetyltransferase complex protein AlgI